MTSRSKAKGNSAERELCKYLEEVFGGSWTRVPNSGSFVGGKNAFRKKSLSESQIKLTKGDIITPDFMPRFVLESKFYKDFRFHQLLQPGPVPALDIWIEQCLDAVDENDLWMVAFKINLRGWYIVVEQNSRTEKFVFHNYSRYTESKFGSFFVTDLKTFMEENWRSIRSYASALECPIWGQPHAFHCPDEKLGDYEVFDGPNGKYRVSGTVMAVVEHHPYTEQQKHEIRTEIARLKELSPSIEPIVTTHGVNPNLPEVTIHRG